MKLKRWTSLALFAVVVAAGSLLLRPGSAKAATLDCSNQANWGIHTGSSWSPAGLIVKVTINGALATGKAVTITNTDQGSKSIGDSNLDDSSRVSSVTKSSGEQCAGYVVLGNGSSSAQGDGTVLDCEQWTGGYTSNPAHFTVSLADLPNRTGSWSYSATNFTVANGYTTTITVNWNDSSPANAAIKVTKTITAGYGATLADVDGARIYLNSVSSTANPAGWAVAPGTYNLGAAAVTGYTMTISDTTPTAYAGQTTNVTVTYAKKPIQIVGYKVDASGNNVGPYSSAPILVTTAVGTTDNPFSFTRAEGDYYIYAPGTTGGYHAIRIDLLCNGAPGVCGSVSSNLYRFTAVAGTAYDFRVVFAQDNGSSCAPLRTANPSNVAGGGTFNASAAFTNTGSQAWTTPGYRIAVAFQNNSTASGTPAGTVDVDTMKYQYMDSVSVAGGGTAYADTASVPSNSASFTAPTTPGTYYLNETMVDGSGTPFGATCSYPVTVSRLYDYAPQIGSSAGGSASIPASSALVVPGQAITITETIRNRQTTPVAPGDDYTWKLAAYSGTYQSGASSMNFGADSSIATGAGTGIPAGGAASQTAIYTVPASAVDGTEICFYGTVSPASHTSLSAADPQVASRATNFATMSYEDGTNVRTNYAPGAMVANDLCVEVQHLRSAQLQVQQGDVHAGGNLGEACASPAAGTTSIRGNGGASYAEYVTSAAGSVTGFGSGNAGSSALTLSNTAGGGNYGYICRPDLSSTAASYPRAGTIAGSSVNVGALGSGLWYHSGTLTITGGTIGVGHRVTIYNEGDVVVTGNVTLSSTPANIANIPSFGVITGSGGNIKISGAVTSLQGFYDANNTTDANGYIDTCYEHDPSGPSSPSHNTGDCPSTLSVFGSLTGHHLYFWRTGATGSFQGGSVVTETVRQSGILFLAPPPAFETQAGTTYGLPQYNGETTPLY